MGLVTDTSCTVRNCTSAKAGEKSITSSSRTYFCRWLWMMNSGGASAQLVRWALSSATDHLFPARHGHISSSVCLPGDAYKTTGSLWGSSAAYLPDKLRLYVVLLCQVCYLWAVVKLRTAAWKQRSHLHSKASLNHRLTLQRPTMHPDFQDWTTFSKCSIYICLNVPETQLKKEP